MQDTKTAHSNQKVKKNFNNSSKNETQVEQVSPVGTVGTTIRRHPVMDRVRAPITGKPSMSPMVDLKPRSLRDAFSQPLELGSETEGFIPRIGISLLRM